MGTALGSMRGAVVIAVAMIGGCGDDPGTPVDAVVVDAPPDGPPPPSLDDVDVIVGPEQVMFDWTTQRCEDLDLPDTSAHAIRISSGVVLSATNAPTSYFGFGPDLDTITHSCTPVMTSAQSTPPDLYTHWQWPASIYREGATIYMLAHDEYHDPVATNCLVGDLSPANPCWWNSITLATSTDEGHTFTHAPSPANLVAAPHLRWDPTVLGTRPPKPSGYMEPSNIVKAADGYYYTAIRALLSPTDPSQDGTCVLRTNNLAAPGSWRFWDGSGWSGVFVDPYSVPAGTPIASCAFVSQSLIGQLHGSLTYNTLFERFLLVGAAVFTDATNTPVCGFYASTSPDFVTWSPPKLLRQAPLGFGPCATGQYAYPSLIDPTDTSTNFERTGATSYLYAMKNNGGLDRDLVRVSVEFRRR